MDGLKSMSRSCFDADALMHELYNKSWLGRFTLQQVEKKEQEGHRRALEQKKRQLLT